MSLAVLAVLAPLLVTAALWLWAGYELAQHELGLSLTFIAVMLVALGAVVLVTL